MKDSSFYLSIETDEKGYKVTRKKYFNPYYDKAMMIDILDEVKKWISKPTNVMIDLLGNGTTERFKQRSLMRIIKDSHYHEGYNYTTIWFGDSGYSRPQDTKSKAKALKDFKYMLTVLVPDYMIIEK